MIDRMVEAGAGEHISISAKRLVAEARAHGSAKMIFNDVELSATPNTTAKDVEGAYERHCNERHVAWLNSDERKVYEAKREQEIAALQERHDDLLADLKSLDWSNDVAILDWLLAIQPATDHVGVIVNKEAIARSFAQHGYHPNVNTGDAYRGDDRANSHAYIVGQALDTLAYCGIHPVFTRFATDWKNRFVI